MKEKNEHDSCSLDMTGLALAIRKTRGLISLEVFLGRGEEAIKG